MERGGGGTPRGESCFKPHLSSNPHSKETARRLWSRSPGAQAAHFSRLRGASRLPPTDRAPAHSGGGLPDPAGVPGDAHTRSPRISTLPEVPGDRLAAAHVSALCSFLTLRLAEEAEPLFRGSEAHIPETLPSGVKNEAEQWLWGGGSVRE